MKECRKRPGNLINRKLSEFYIEAVPRFFSNSEKKYFGKFFSIDKKFAIEKISVEKTFEKKMLNQNVDFFFSTEKIFIFSTDIFLIFFSIAKKYVFSELKKKIEHSFDVEFCVLSIYEVSRAFPALLDAFWSHLAYALVWGVLL